MTTYEWGPCYVLFLNFVSFCRFLQIKFLILILTTSYGPRLGKFWVVRKEHLQLQSAPAPPIFFIRQKVLYIIKKKFENRKDVPFPLEKVKNKPSLFWKNKKKQELMFFSLAVREISTKTLLEKTDADITFTYCYRSRQ